MVSITALITAAAAVSSFALKSLAHPGEHHEDVSVAIAKRNAHGVIASRSLAECSGKLKFRQLQERAMMRRFEKAENMRKERGITSKPYLMRCDLAALQNFETVNHDYTSSGYTLDTDPSMPFGANTSCILTPELTEGPYWVTGEYIRSSLVESQEGVPLHVEFQIIDVATCEPVQDVMMDLGLQMQQACTLALWQVVTNNTALRGLQATDADGVAAFDTIFPGHYQGRTTHLHVMAHQNGTILPNATYSGGVISHVGQVFLDEALKEQVEATYPYTTNTQATMTNDEDGLAQSSAENDYDPFVEYAYLSDDVTAGLIAWISIGIDTSAAYNMSAAVYGADGGTAQNNTGSVGGPGGLRANGTFGGNGTMSGPSLSGAPPTGPPPSGAASVAALAISALTLFGTLSAPVSSASRGEISSPAATSVTSRLSSAAESELASSRPATRSRRPSYASAGAQASYLKGPAQVGNHGLSPSSGRHDVPTYAQRRPASTSLSSVP